MIDYEEGSVWSAGCLADIQDFVKCLALERTIRAEFRRQEAKP